MLYEPMLWSVLFKRGYVILLDLIGERFNKLVVLKRVDNDTHKNTRWLCACECGKEKIIVGYNLKSGNTQSCGCLNVEKIITRSTKHGHNARGKTSKIYISWRNMIQRCGDPKSANYNNYGGRGITVCQWWMKFENFLEDMGEPPTDQRQIDRIDNDGNYCKANCRWATPKEQNRNRRDNHLETHNGKTQCLAVWAEELNINYNTLCSRIFTYNWPVEKALTTPVKKKGK